MANVFANRIEESVNVDNEIWRRRQFGPEQFKIALFENIGQFNDVVHFVVFHLCWQQKTLAQREIGVRKVGQCFQQNQISDVQIQHAWIELIQLQHSQICFQIIFVRLGLFAHIVF